MEFDDLYQRYVDEYSSRPRYTNGHATISEQDLMDQLGAEIDDLLAEYGSLSDFASPDEANMVFEIYSTAEAQVVFEELIRRSSS